MGNDKVYVLLAVRNGEKYIEQAIKSVLNQTYKNFFLIVIINDSTDDTVRIVNSINLLQSKIGPEFTVIELLKPSKSKSINLFISVVHDQIEAFSNIPKCIPAFFAIQDADDIWHPTKLEEQMKYANAYDVIGTDCNYIDADGNQIDINPRSKPYLHEKIVDDAFSGHNPITNCSALIRAKLLFDHPYDQSLDGIEDYDLWLRLMRYTNAKFINLPQKLVDHRIHAESHFNTKKFDIQSLINKYKK